MTQRPLEGLTVVVTGEIGGLDRSQAQAAVTALGGTPSGSVSAKTNLIVTGAGAGLSKMEKARRFGTLVLDGAVFAALAADPHSWNGQPLGEPLPAPEPAAEREPQQRSPHELAVAVLYPNGQRLVKRSCRCGHRDEGSELADASRPCSQDPLAR